LDAFPLKFSEASSVDLIWKS